MGFSLLPCRHCGLARVPQLSQGPQAGLDGFLLLLAAMLPAHLWALLAAAAGLGAHGAGRVVLVL